jgi:hypothetical protein
LEKSTKWKHRCGHGDFSTVEDVLEGDEEKATTVVRESVDGRA